MSTLFMLLLCSVGVLADTGRIYKNARRLIIEVHQRTSECFHAGTDCNITTSVGFTDSTGVLRYAIRNPTQRGNLWMCFEKGILDLFAHEVPDADFKKAEQACADFATSSSGFDSIAYDNCFNVNLVHYETNPSCISIGADWKPADTSVILYITLSDGSVQRRKITFKPLQSCSVDWVKGGSGHFLCHGEGLRTRQASKYLPRTNKLEVGNTYVCPK
uniref:C-type lectin domain-containing protein n=1 Tax=Steinernema glaseri TaxID=37863 RepID=A0A1I7ZNI6_9BILA